MFIELFTLPYTFFVFLFGYVILFPVMLIKKLSLVSILWTSFVGGIAFVGIWACILMILQFLLTQHELRQYFHLLDTKRLQDYSEKTDDDDDLTVDELYNQSNPSSISSDAVENDISQNTSLNFLKHNNNSDLDALTSNNTGSKSEVSSSLNADGTFDFSVNGRTVQSTPKEGAQAITKVLVDDQKND